MNSTTTLEPVTATTAVLIVHDNGYGTDAHVTTGAHLLTAWTATTCQQRSPLAVLRRVERPPVRVGAWHDWLVHTYGTIGVVVVGERDQPPREVDQYDQVRAWIVAQVMRQTGWPVGRFDDAVDAALRGHWFDGVPVTDWYAAEQAAKA